MSKYILGIESSCDDTSAAIVDRDGNVLSSVVVHQNQIHNDFGGVYPEFASRAHLQNAVPTVNQAIEDAGISLDDIKAIGVTRGPGLMGSLLVGINTATALGMGWNKPVVGINHLRGHLRSAELEGHPMEYPATLLLVSGGHTLLAYMKSASDIEMLGGTRDDSVGETYDKVGRMLGLDFPAGPLVDRLAKQGEANIDFPRPLLQKGYEFSFSGLKSALSRHLNSGIEMKKEDIAASFVEAVMDTLIHKCRRALKNNPSKSLSIVGGVAASPQLRARAQELCDEMGVKLSLPPIKWSTDNAAMIALAAWDYVEQDRMIAPMPQARIPLAEF